MGNCTSTSSTNAKQENNEAETVPAIVDCSPSVEEKGGPTDNEKLVQACCHNMNDTHAPDNLSNYCTLDAIFNFKDTEAEMTCQDFFESTTQARDSFPDLAFRWDSVEEINPEVVIIRNFRGSGTHTGTPYAFGPYPAIAPTGKTFQDPPLDISCTIHGGKISHMLIDAFGKPSGPPGIYAQIGGILF